MAMLFRNTAFLSGRVTVSGNIINIHNCVVQWDCIDTVYGTM